MRTTGQEMPSVGAAVASCQLQLHAFSTIVLASSLDFRLRPLLALAMLDIPDDASMASARKGGGRDGSPLPPTPSLHIPALRRRSFSCSL